MIKQQPSKTVKIPCKKVPYKNSIKTDYRIWGGREKKAAFTEQSFTGRIREYLEEEYL